MRFSYVSVCLNATFTHLLGVLARAKVAKSQLITKTSVMLGLGETDEDIRATMRDLRDNGVDILTFGQYLRCTIVL